MLDLGFKNVGEATDCDEFFAIDENAFSVASNAEPSRVVHVDFTRRPAVAKIVQVGVDHGQKDSVDRDELSQTDER